MKNKELIELLQMQDPDEEVVMDKDEDGWHAIEGVSHSNDPEDGPMTSIDISK